MKKYMVNATIVTTMSIHKIIEAENLSDATVSVLMNINPNEWVTKQELKVSSK
jgi:hypothetical protein